MDLTAMLCNHAEVQNNVLYVSGGGIDRAHIPVGLATPWQVSLGVAMSLEVPWAQADQEHSVRVTLHDADGQPVDLPMGAAGRQQFAMEIRFGPGSVAGTEAGESQRIALALNMPSLQLDQLGRYTFVISVDGVALRRLPYRLVNQPDVLAAAAAPAV